MSLTSTELWKPNVEDNIYVALCKKWRQETHAKGMTQQQIDLSFYSFMSIHLPHDHPEKRESARLALWKS